MSLPTPEPGGLRLFLACGALAAASPLPLGLYAWVPFLGFLPYVALEWFRSTIAPAHFDRYALAHSQAGVTPLVQIADLTGASGVSFLVAAFNGWVADVIVDRRSRRAAGAADRRGPNVWRTAAVLASLFVAALGYGFARLSRAVDEPGPRIALVQPDVAHHERNAVGVHLSEVIFGDERIPAGSADLIVWPENAVLDNLRRPGMYLPDLARLAGDKGAPLLVGAMGKASEAPGKTTNAAYLVDRDGDVLGEARKQVLFPWSEMVPGDAFLERAMPRLWRAQRALVRKGWGFVPTGLPGRGGGEIPR